jgi:hypothetical protein
MMGGGLKGVPLSLYSPYCRRTDRLASGHLFITGVWPFLSGSLILHTAGSGSGTLTTQVGQARGCGCPTLFWLPAGCSVNGVVWTGGFVHFDRTADDPEVSKYLAATQAILEYVLARNEGGTYYPLWATCLGFERLIQLLARDVNRTIIDTMDATNMDINLSLTPSGWLSRMFGGMSHELFKEVSAPPPAGFPARIRARVV